MTHIDAVIAKLHQITDLQRTTFRGFHGDHLVARVTRVTPSSFSVTVERTTLTCTNTTLSAAHAVAALAAQRMPPGHLAWAA